MWPFLLLLHVIGLTGYNLVLRNSVLKNVDRFTLATIMQTGVALPMLVVLFLFPPEVGAYTPAIVLQIVATTFLVILLHVSNVKSVQYLEAGVYSVLFNLRIIFTTILGIIFLSEDLVVAQVIGGLLIFLSVLFVRQKGTKELTLLGIRWGIFASVVISVLNLSEKSILNNVSFSTYAVPTMLLASIIMWGLLIHRSGRVEIKSITNSNSLLLMSLRALSAYGALLALNFGASLSIYTYISSLSVVTTVLFGVILLKERDHLTRKIISTLIAVIGFTIILVVNL